MPRRVPSVTARQALEVSRLWEESLTAVTHLRSGENSIWRVESADRKRVLRLTSPAHRTWHQLEAELDFVEHVAEGGLGVARPLRARSGARVLEVPDSFVPGERIHATLFHHLAGRHFEYHSSELDLRLFRAWGEAMARLHALSGTFQAREGFRRPQWFDDEVAGCGLGGAVLHPETEALRRELLRWLRALEPEARHYGMVHGDFERTNYVLDGGSIRLFDFDDCCRHWFVWDIVCALWAFRNAPREDRRRFLAWCLEGYASVRPPDTERLAHFSELTQLRTIALLLRRLRDPAAVAGEAERSWLDRTQEWVRSTWSW